MSKTLDLGCGDKPRNPFLADELYGVDVRSNLAGNIRSADLVVEPIPFDDASVDYVSAYDFVEHVPRIVYAPQRRNAFVELMNEVHRVLKPGGLFASHTPAYPHAVAFRDPTHVNIITDETFTHYFDDTIRWGSIYGFRGAFTLRRQEWRGPNLLTVMQKVEAPDAAPPPGAGSRISVFIPVHNGEKHLQQTLESVLAQSHADFEVICIDDASTDGSAAILQRHAQRDARIRVVTTPANLGSAPRALNHALPLMTGDYFVYASQDDLFSADWLERMHARAVETGADAVIPEVVFHHPQAPAQDRRLVGLNGDRGARLSGREAARLSLDWSIAGNALWRAALVRTLGFETFAINADEYSVRRFFLQCREVAFSAGQFLYRQDNPDAVTKRDAPLRFDWPYTQLRIAQLLREHGFENGSLQREIAGAQRAMAKLNAALNDPAHPWSSAQRADAQARATRFHDRLALEHLLASPPWPQTPGERLRAKWKKSLRKLPRKLGLR